MKLSVWLLFLALLVVSGACWVGAHGVLMELQVSRPKLPLPDLSHCVLPHGVWFLTVPVPWLIWAVVLTVRHERGHEAFLVYSSSIILTISVLTCLTLLACVMPYLDLINV